VCDSFWTPNSELAVRSYFYLRLAGVLFLAIVAFSLVSNERDAIECICHCASHSLFAFCDCDFAPTGSQVTSGEVESAASSMDSDLEAFSHNPTHGSFAPLAFQPSAMTNYVNQRFLSY